MYDNDGQYVVVHNPAISELTPSMRGLWSRLDWAWSDDNLYYCWSVSEAATADAAIIGLITDHSAIDFAAGCNERAWTSLVPVE